LENLKSQLKAWLKNLGKLVLVGVGNPMLGDDGVGVMVVKALQRKGENSKLKLVEGGIAPENFTGKIVSEKPTHILMVDAAVFEGEPGSVRLFPIEQVSGLALSTHRLPLTFLAEYLQRSIPQVKIALLAVKPGKVGFGLKPSRKIVKMAERLAEAVFKAVEEA